MDTTTRSLFEKLTNEADILRKAALVLELRKDFEIQVKEIAQTINKHPSYVSHLLRLQKIPQIVVDGYYGHLISATHLMLLSRLDDEASIIELYQEVLKKSLTVAQTDAAVRTLRYDVTDDGADIDTEALTRIQTELSEELGAKVTVLQTRVRTKIVLEVRGSVTNTTAFLNLVRERLQIKLTEEEKGSRLKILE